MRGQFLEHIKSLHIDAILGWMLWSYNVLGSHAWPISRTYQIVAHWCNSWVTVASLVDRRISMITARSCTCRQMGPIQRKPFVDIHFFCVLSWVMWRPDHTDVSQLERQRLDTIERMTREIDNISRPEQSSSEPWIAVKFSLKKQHGTPANFFLTLF